MIQENYDATRGEGSSEQLRRQITATRHRMSGTLQEIGEELKPKQLMENYVDEYSEALVRDIKEKSKKLARTTAETIRRNPLPVFAILAGLAVLATRSKRSEGRRSKSSITTQDSAEGENKQNNK